MTEDRVYLLIGPSGIGKSSAIDKVDHKDLLKFKLEDVVKNFNNQSSVSDYFSRIGNENFFKESINAIERIKQENPDKNILIDVGTDTIDWDGCTDRLLDYKLISLTCDKEKLYSRVKNRSTENRTFDQYISSEFKPHKELLYDKAQFVIDTTHLDTKEVADEIERALNVTTFNFKYKPTPLNIAAGLFVLWLLYAIIANGITGEAKLAIVIFIPVVVVSFILDFILQSFIKKYIWLTCTEIALIGLVSYWTVTFNQ